MNIRKSRRQTCENEGSYDFFFSFFFTQQIFILFLSAMQEKLGPIAIGSMSGSLATVLLDVEAVSLRAVQGHQTSESCVLR